MSLATRCSSCGTVFRVVTDQLRVSEGWVRCGRCDAVFDATESLFDIDTGEPVVVPGLVVADAQRAGTDELHKRGGEASRADPEPPVAGTARQAQPAAAEHDPLADVVPADWHIHQRLREAGRAAAAGSPATMAPQAEPGPLLHTAANVDDADGGTPSQLMGWMRPQRRSGATTTADGDSLMPPPAPPGASEPSFVREAERAQWWARPPVQRSLLAGCGLLGLLLVAQLALLWRDALAAHLPALAGPLRSLCAVAGCQVQPLRRIERLSVDSSGLNRAEGSPYYKLQLTLRNRGDTALMLPALDLSLTDNQGKLVARRVLQGAELGLARTVGTIERGQELPIKVMLSTGDARVDGYTLELFYP